MKLFVTGHRPDKLGGYGRDVSLKLVVLANEMLREIKPTLVITGMALGWDQAVARACMINKIPFDAYIPFVGQEAAWPDASQRDYHNLLEHANWRHICCVGGYAGWKMNTRNMMMVDAGDQGLALWNGTSGGTANCMRYARQKGKQVRNCWEEWAC